MTNMAGFYFFIPEILELFLLPFYLAIGPVGGKIPLLTYESLLRHMLCKILRDNNLFCILKAKGCTL